MFVKDMERRLASTFVQHSAQSRPKLAILASQQPSTYIALEVLKRSKCFDIDQIYTLIEDRKEPRQAGSLTLFATILGFGQHVVERSVHASSNTKAEAKSAKDFVMYLNTLPNDASVMAMRPPTELLAALKYCPIEVEAACSKLHLATTSMHMKSVCASNDKLTELFRSVYKLNTTNSQFVVTDMQHGGDRVPSFQKWLSSSALPEAAIVRDVTGRHGIPMAAMLTWTTLS
jgi:hypothetical protein